MEKPNDNKDLIENVLKKNSQDIEFEPIPEENESPLAQPVVEKSNTSSQSTSSKNETKQQAPPDPSEQSAQQPKQEQNEKTSDAPEQEINQEPAQEEKQQKASQENGEFSMPLEHARLMADSIIGSINNTVLEIGGGYFVTIRKHKDFYDFEEIIQVIDEQNVKNIRRLKLDEEDKALLRPLLVQILRKKAVELSPEKQLLMVALSILIKKAKMVMEIRTENEMLVERIRDVIRKEVNAAMEERSEHIKERSGQEQSQNNSDQSENKKEEKKPDQEETVYEEVVYAQKTTGLPDEALETFK